MTIDTRLETSFAATPRPRAPRMPRLLLALGGSVGQDAVDAARAALEVAGVPVTVARDARSALESGLHDPPDALLIDPNLPAADVVSTLRFAGFRGPVLAWDAGTGGAPTGTRAACAIDGTRDFVADAWVVPPLDVGALLAGPLAGAAAIDDAQGFDALPEFAQMQACFDEALPATLARLRSLAQGRAWGELARELHRLKGMAGTFGRDDLTRDAQRAGALLAQGRVDAACALCAAMAVIDGAVGRGSAR